MTLEQFNQQNSDLNDNPNLSLVELSVAGAPSFTIYTLEGVTYSPDDNGWSGIGRVGLWETLQQHQNPQIVVDYGTGPGTALVLAAQDPRTKLLIGCDIADEVLAVAAHTVEQAGILGQKTVDLYNATPTELASHLISEEVRADIVYFCLPQVPFVDGRNLTTREAGDYYDADDFPAYKEWGLGLVFEALQSSKELLSPSGQVVAVLGGRTPYDVKVQMIKHAGFVGEIIEQCFVQQDPQTSLEPFEKENGMVLYKKDENEQMVPISITEAIIRQKSAGSELANVWHTVEVWRMKPI